MTGVVDYGAGNLKSVETALRHLGADFRISDIPAELAESDRLIFPGVGEAASAMANLRAGGWPSFLEDYAASGRPFLGICLGSQIILNRSQEGDAPCLGLIPGEAQLFTDTPGFAAEGPLKVPHMGWNTLEAEAEHPLLEGIPRGSSFYFVHSFFPAPDETLPGVSVLARCTYGLSFAAAYARGNVMATQFHPEKSGPPGLRMLRNFLSLGAADFQGGV